jgi:hypothetical protein
MADADRAHKRRSRQLGFEIVELAFRAPPLDFPILEGRDTRRIIAAIFEPLQRLNDGARRWTRSENPDNPTHLSHSPINVLLNYIGKRGSLTALPELSRRKFLAPLICRTTIADSFLRLRAFAVGARDHHLFEERW